MKNKNFILMVGTAVVIALTNAGPSAIAKEKAAGAEKSKMDAKFIKKAANGGMTEVELGKIAAKNGQKDDVKSFGERMVKDHSKANDELKSIASKMNVDVPSKVNAKHQAMIDKFAKMTGESFDTAYVKAMVEDHKKDIAEFEEAQGQVKNEDLKKFISDTVPVMKEHLEMVEKMEAAK